MNTSIHQQAAATLQALRQHLRLGPGDKRTGPALTFAAYMVDKAVAIQKRRGGDAAPPDYALSADTLCIADKALQVFQGAAKADPVATRGARALEHLTTVRGLIAAIRDGLESGSSIDVAIGAAVRHRG